MIPKRVVLENFLSFGPRTEVEFTDDEPLWVVGGPNGVGKSAVFDAITFCLFGEHRGSDRKTKDKDGQLTRHGSNGFSVLFEFEFDTVEYRISRNRVGKKPTQSLEFRPVGGTAWQRVPNVNSTTDLDGWAVRTLGLSFDSFKASVLLRQGESDAIINARPTDRLTILKKIIGVERYEDLSKRVHEATRGKRLALDQLTGQLAQVAEVTTEERTEVGRMQSECGAARQIARDAETAAAARVEQARQWVGLASQLAEAEKRLAAAHGRRGVAADIRDRHERLVELEAVVPAVQELVQLRDARAGADAALAAMRETNQQHVERRQSAADAAEAARDSIERHRGEADHAAEIVRTLEQRLKDDRHALSTAKEVARVDGELAQLPANLDALRPAAESEFHEAEAAAAGVLHTRTEVALRLRDRTEELTDFEKVEIGPKCKRCRQPVSAEFAEHERCDLAETIARLTDQATAAEKEHAAAIARVNEAKAERDRLNKAANTREKLAIKRQALVRHGEVPAAAVLSARIAADEPEQSRQQERHDTARQSQAVAAEAATRHDGERLAGEAELKRTEARLATAERDQVRAAERRAVLAGTLRGDWAGRWESLSATEATALAAESRALAASGVREELRLLQDDEARRDEWERSRGETQTAIDGIPPESRITVAAATSQLEAATRAAADRTGEWDAARSRYDEQTTRIERRSILTQQVRTAEAEARIHDKLDDRLGKAGLQRELVRDAETQIVGFAQAILHNLSGGDLSIELDRSAQNDDEALVLLVRRSEHPTPIGVAYLSGSQKFRVAISIALAIGQFAAGGQARRLECVIIDEGFGSLDKDGLKAAAEELNRLKQFLRRIVLVSHQEDFTDHFPVVIRLSKGENGTTAEKVRR